MFDLMPEEYAAIETPEAVCATCGNMVQGFAHLDRFGHDFVSLEGWQNSVAGVGFGAT